MDHTRRITAGLPSNEESNSIKKDISSKQKEEKQVKNKTKTIPHHSDEDDSNSFFAGYN